MGEVKLPGQKKKRSWIRCPMRERIIRKKRDFDDRE